VLGKKKIVICEKVMSTEIISLGPGDRAIEAVNLMKAAGISQMPIIQKGMPVGSVTERGLMKYIGTNLNRKRVRDVMERSFPVISAGDSVEIAKGLLEHYQAVLASKDVGIVTKSDLLSLMK
jgi:predicted transcriptional regulator